jgi:putative protease
MSEEEVQVGVVTHYFGHISVGAVQVTEGELAVGDTIHVKGHTADFTMTIESMQLEHENVEKAKKGDVVGIKVPERVHEHDKVYKTAG